MIIDTLTRFADAGDFSQATGTKNVGDVVDLGEAARDIGNGKAVYLVVVVTTAADGGSGKAATVAFQLVSDATETIAVDGSQTVHFTSDAFTASQLPAGRMFAFALPSGSDYERYLGMQVVTGTEAETSLACTAFLSLDQVGWKAYPDATN